MTININEVPTSIPTVSGNDLVAQVEAARAAAETARDQAQTAAANAQASALTCATWAVLSGLTGSTAGQGAEVLDSDGDSHTDPVTGALNTPNAGRYTWSASPAGWKRIGDTGLSARPTFAEMQNAIWDETGFAYPLVTFDGREWRSLVLDDDGLFVSGEDAGGTPYRAYLGEIIVALTGTYLHPLIAAYDEITLDLLGRPVAYKLADGSIYEARDGMMVRTVEPRVATAYDYDYVTGLAGPREDIDYLFLAIGQSYAQGHDGSSAQVLTATAQHPGYALMASNGVRTASGRFAAYADLVEQSASTTLKETIASGMADAMERRIYAALGRKQRLVFGIAANGGNRWWDSRYGATGGWKQGTTTWRALCNYIQSAKEVSESQGRKLVVAGLIVAGGESDNFSEFSTGDTASWMRILDRIQSDITTDARTITGQSDPVPIYHYQVGFPTANGLQDPVTAKAALAASLRNTLVRCLGPLGAYDGSADGVHLASTGYRTLGTYIGNYIAQDLWGIGETPLYCLDAWWDEASPIIHMRYSKPLAIDDGSIINLTGLGAGKGVDFTDGSASPPTVTGIAVNGSNSRQLDVTLSALPTGRRPQVHVGCRATGTNHGNQTGLRCAVRSADLIDTDTITGDEIYHWACAQTVNVPL